MILVIDNYDSFTYNLVQYLGELGVDMQVRRNDEISLDANPRAEAGAHPGVARPVFAARIRPVERSHPHVCAAKAFRFLASASATSASATRSARRSS